MSCFDWVNFETVCPDCGELVDGFQSKDGRCCLEKIDPDRISNMYSACPNCGRWVEFIRDWEEDEDKLGCRPEPYSLDEVENMGFRLTERR